MDGHPLLHPVLMEVIQAVTYDNLSAMRAISVLCSTLAIAIAWAVGRRAAGPAVGICAAGLICGSSASCYYGSVARTYALSELGVLCVLLAVTATEKKNGYLNSCLLLAAIFGQMTHWLAWPIIGPVVLCAAIFDLADGAPLTHLLRRSWWYCLASGALLCYLFIQRINPTLRGVGSFSWSLSEAFGLFSSIAPTGGAVWLPPVAVISAATLLALACFGLTMSYRATPRREIRQWVLLLAAPVAGSVAVLILGPGQNRYYLPATVPFALAAAFCFRAVPSIVASACAIALSLSATMIPFIAPRASDPYLSEWLPGASSVAARLTSELKQTGRWVSYPYYLADRLYRDLQDSTQPAQPQTQPQFEAFLATEHPTTVIALKSNIDQWKNNVEGELVFVLDIDQTVTCYRFIPTREQDTDKK
jgi:uncharacterized membrane protein